VVWTAPAPARQIADAKTVKLPADALICIFDGKVQTADSRPRLG